MQKKLAFTFIEVMVAIVVFSIGILAVLKLVTNNLDTMDRNNVRVQATLLAKEGVELIYNMRDSNLKKELSWNCVMNEDMHGWASDDLSSAIGWGNQSNFEDVICAGYFGITGSLQISFDPDRYVYSKLIDVSPEDIFDDLYNKNRLYLYTGDIASNSISWYGYDYEFDDIDDIDGKDTYFSRYISFDAVKEGENVLPLSKIMKITSHVLYKKGGNEGEVVFESFIGNY